MFLPLVAVAWTTAVIAGVVCWGVARRYGRRRALVVPVVAVAAAVISVFRGGGLDHDDSMLRAAVTLALAGPAVAGALVGLVLARRG